MLQRKPNKYLFKTCNSQIGDYLKIPLTYATHEESLKRHCKHTLQGGGTW